MKLHVVYVPGLHDQHPINYIGTRLIAFLWRFFGFRGHVIKMRWEDGRPLDEKIDRIIVTIDELHAKGHRVILLGQSAGGSAVMLAYAQRLSKVLVAINNCGRLRVAGQPSLEAAAKGSPAFAESVKRCEAILPTLPAVRIITLRPFADKVVPATAVPVDGAINASLLASGHSTGGILAATIYAGVWMTACKAHVARAEQG